MARKTMRKAGVGQSAKASRIVKARPEWKEPLLKILEGHEDLAVETSDFPKLGRLAAMKDLREFERVVAFGPDTVTPVAAGAAVGVVVVVVCVAVAARPGAVPSKELLRAKLLDVYGPKERQRLREAIRFVRSNPTIVKVSLGVEMMELGDNFDQRLASVDAALA